MVERKNNYYIIKKTIMQLPSGKSIGNAGVKGVSEIHSQAVNKIGMEIVYMFEVRYNKTYIRLEYNTESRANADRQYIIDQLNLTETNIII